MPSFFENLKPIVDEWLNAPVIGTPPHFEHSKTLIELSRRGTFTPPFLLLPTLLKQLQLNWDRHSPIYSNPSDMNWRRRIRPESSPNMTSPEKRLERRIVGLGQGWSNEIPVCSGYVDSTADSRSCVDLVEKITDENFRLVELKVDSNNPLFAAIEILLYGAAYLFTRQNQVQLGYEDRQLLNVPKIEFAVLAPDVFYSRYELGWLNDLMRTEMRTTIASAPELSFVIESLPLNPSEDYTDEDLLKALQNRSTI
jgi:hypothetical protein